MPAYSFFVMIFWVRNGVSTEALDAWLARRKNWGKNRPTMIFGCCPSKGRAMTPLCWNAQELQARKLRIIAILQAAGG